MGDVAVANPVNPRALRVHLEQSKMDQTWNGIDVFVGRLLWIINAFLFRVVYNP